KKDETRHDLILMSERLIEGAVEDAQLRKLKSLAGHDPVEVIRDGLSARLEGGQKDAVMRVAFRGSDTTDATPSLNAVAQSYTAFASSAFGSEEKVASALIASARDRVENDLAKKEEELRQFLAKSPPFQVGAAQSESTFAKVWEAKTVEASFRRA